MAGQNLPGVTGVTVSNLRIKRMCKRTVLHLTVTGHTPALDDAPKSGEVVV